MFNVGQLAKLRADCQSALRGFSTLPHETASRMLASFPDSAACQLQISG
jgi:hypothetical protein